MTLMIANLRNEKREKLRGNTSVYITPIGFIGITQNGIDRIAIDLVKERINESAQLKSISDEIWRYFFEELYTGTEKQELEAHEEEQENEVGTLTIFIEKQAQIAIRK